MNKKKNTITFAAFLILMVGLGANDAMRGIFSTIFSAHFQLTTAELSQIVTVSYIGNLVFLAVGGFGVDLLGRRKAMLLYTFLWSAAMLLFATTDSYLLLLVGMFFAMGTSTLLNTNLNLITTGMFAAAPGFFVNFLFFIQGIGTSGSQSVIGNWATDFSSWHTVTWVLLAIGVIAMVLFVLFPMPEPTEQKSEEKTSPKNVMACPAFLPLVFIFGLYFIAEHGIMNWLVSYATNALGVPMGQAANYTAVFFGGVMVGRLVLSSLVDKLGIYCCLRIFATSSAVLYTAGVLLGTPVLAQSCGFLRLRSGPECGFSGGYSFQCGVRQFGGCHWLSHGFPHYARLYGQLYPASLGLFCKSEKTGTV